MIPGEPVRYSMTRYAGRIHRRNASCGEVAESQPDACVPVVVVDPTDVEQARRLLGRLLGLEPDRVPALNVAAWQGAMHAEATS